MSQDKTKHSSNRWIVYTVYCILLACTLLYYRFPSKAFGNYLQNTLNRISQTFSFSIEGASPSLPLGIKVQKTELANKKTPKDSLFTAENLFIRPKILSFYKKVPEVILEYPSSGGKVTGNIKLTENSLEGPLKAAFTINNIPINYEYNPLTFSGHRVEGTLNGSGTFTGKSSSLITGSGETKLSFSDLRITLLQPFMGFEYIEFSEVLLNADLTKSKLNIPSIALKGQKINGTVSGSIYLKGDLYASILDLNGSIKPNAEFVQEISGINNTAAILNQVLKGGKISLKITGTLKDPKVRFL